MWSGLNFGARFFRLYLRCAAFCSNCCAVFILTSSENILRNSREVYFSNAAARKICRPVRFLIFRGLPGDFSSFSRFRLDSTLRMAPRDRPNFSVMTRTSTPSLNNAWMTEISVSDKCVLISVFLHSMIAEVGA